MELLVNVTAETLTFNPKISWATPCKCSNRPTRVCGRWCFSGKKNDKTCFFPGSLQELLWSLEESWDVDESATIAFSCMNQVSRLPFPKEGGHSPPLVASCFRGTPNLAGQAVGHQ